MPALRRNPAPSCLIGLRFRKSQARVLEGLCESFRRRGERQHLDLFEQAAQAARSGQPLKVRSATLEEAQAVADGFRRYGVVAPEVEAASAVR